MANHSIKAKLISLTAATILTAGCGVSQQKTVTASQRHGPADAANDSNDSLKTADRTGASKADVPSGNANAPTAVTPTSLPTSEPPPSPQLPPPAYTFAAVGYSGNLITSRDGVTWSTPITEPLGPYGDNNYTFRNVCAGPGRIVAVGGGTQVAGTDWYARIYVTTDGTTWTKAFSDLGNWLGGCAYQNGLYLIVGGGARYLTSTDGLNWQVHSQIPFKTGDNPGGVFPQMRGVAAGNGVFVAWGDRGLFATTTDGTDWVVTHPIDDDPAAITNVRFVHDRFVAKMNGQVTTSRDGKTWTTPNGPSPLGTVWVDGKFYVSSNSSGIQTSSTTDFVNWTTAAANVAPGVIAYGQGKFVGFYGYSPQKSYYSTDGATWTVGSTSFSPSSITSLIYVQIPKPNE